MNFLDTFSIVPGSAPVARPSVPLVPRWKRWLSVKSGGEARDLASQLPPELAHSLQRPDAGIGAKLTLDEFFELVSEREGVDLPDATLHARVVIGVLTEAVSLGEIKDVRVQLPAAFAQLFKVENEGDLPQITSL